MCTNDSCVKMVWVFAVLVAMATWSCPPAMGATAYVVPAGTAGNQSYGGPLGMDFNVASPITISDLGVFDANSNGLVGTITASIFDRSTQRQLVSLTFSAANPGTLVGGSRFLPLPVPLILPAGFQGSVVAKGFSSSDQNGNSPVLWTTDSGGGLISFVGSARYGQVADLWPGTPDGGPANRYAAGTFNFDAGSVPGPVDIGAPVVIPNASFELPGFNENGFGTPTSWTPSSTNNAGSFNPPTGTLFTQPIPSGGHVAFANGGHRLDSAVVGKLEADTLYVVEAEWGVRTDQPDGKHSMHLVAGGVQLGYINNLNIFTGPNVPVGEWRTARGYFTASHNAVIGSDLQVRLSNGSSQQVEYDCVRMSKITQASIPVVNPSFESPDVGPNGGWSAGATGWVLSGSGGAFEQESQIVPADGTQSAWVGNGSSLTQTLTGWPVHNGTRYILLVDVADRSSTTFTGYRVELLAGGQVIGVDDNGYTVLSGTGQGFFYTTSVVDVLYDGSLSGLDLGIRLSALNTGGNQTYFDNVRLFAVELPEPCTALLLLAVGPALVRRARRRLAR